MKIKSLDISKKNYIASATEAQSRFKDGIADADWKTNASSPEAEALYATKVQEAISNQSRRKGIEDVSNEEWKQKALSKGGNRIASGMKGGSDDWQRGYSPYHSTIASLELPPRTADAVQNVINRVVPIVEALVAKKKEILG